MGKIAIEWLTAYKTLCKGRDRKKKVESWIWGRRIVEHSLNLIISLWEQQNTEMHGEDTKVSKIRRQRLVTEIQQLQELKERA